MIKKNLKSFFIIFILFFVDRISKILIINKTSQNNQNEIFFSKFINIELVWNKGIAFGLLSFEKIALYHFVTFIIISTIVVILILMVKSQSLDRNGYILISGGALGNLFDRIFYRAVPDFIDIHIKSFHWFIFNIADIFITVGILYLICVEMFIKKIDD